MQKQISSSAISYLTIISWPNMTRNLEDRSGVVNGSPSRNYAGNNRAASRSTAGGKRSPQLEKNERKNFSSGRSANDKPNGSSTPVRSNHNDSASLRTEQEGGATHTNTAPKEEKVNVEMMEWPRIHIALSRKEKEDDFLVMKGTKLPQRPKKRAKNIDRALQVYIYIINLLLIVYQNYSYIYLGKLNNFVGGGVVLLAVLFPGDVAV